MINDRTVMCTYPAGIALAVNIRMMTLDDIEEVMEIDRLSFPVPWPQSTYYYELNSNPSSRLWVAELGKEAGEPKLVGMIVIWLLEDEAHIATIAVHPDFRKERIGSRMLGYSLRELVHEGAREAMLEVRSSNQAAQSLYRKFGFEVVHRRPRYYQDNDEDALLMNLIGLDHINFEPFIGGVELDV